MTRRASRFHLGLLVALACCGGPGFAAAAQTARPLGSTTSPYGYIEYLPPGYDASPDASYPLLIFLHGLGEKGNGTTEVWWAAKHGPGKLISQGSTVFADEGVIVLSPQSPVWWNPGTIDDFVDYCMSAYRIDPDRIWVTGLSMGGGGTVGYALAHLDRLAAIMPICPAINGTNRQALAELPTWIFHNWGDSTVTRWNGINLATSIAKGIDPDAPDCLAQYPHRFGTTANPADNDLTGLFDAGGWSWLPGREADAAGQPRITLYTAGGHDAWTKTYNDPQVWAWLFRQRRGGPARVLQIELAPAQATRFLVAVTPESAVVAGDGHGGGAVSGLGAEQTAVLGWVEGVAQ